MEVARLALDYLNAFLTPAPLATGCRCPYTFS